MRGGRPRGGPERPDAAGRPVAPNAAAATLASETGCLANREQRLANEVETVLAEEHCVTDEAVARGVFGAPTFFVGDAMFFGQDRLDFVREALLAIR